VPARAIEGQQRAGKLLAQGPVGLPLAGGQHPVHSQLVRVLRLGGISWGESQGVGCYGVLLGIAEQQGIHQKTGHALVVVPLARKANGRGFVAGFGGGNGGALGRPLACTSEINETDKSITNRRRTKNITKS
jgi:hypothetical protein